MTPRARALRRLAAAVLVAGLAVAVVPSAAQARPHGPLIPANVYFLSTRTDLAHATDADVVQSGTGFLAESNWRTIAVDQPCPAGTASVQPLVRIPGQTADEDEWEEYPLGPQSFEVDGEGRPVSYEDDNGFALPIVARYLNAHGSHAENFRMVLVCLDANLGELGYFRTAVTIDNHGMTDGEFSPENQKVFPNVVWTPENTDLSNVGQAPPAAGAARDPFPWRKVAAAGVLVLLAAAAAVVVRRGRRTADPVDTAEKKESVSA